MKAKCAAGTIRQGPAFRDRGLGPKPDHLRGQGENWFVFSQKDGRFTIPGLSHG